MPERSFSENGRQGAGRPRMRISRSPSAAPARPRLSIRVVRATPSGLRPMNPAPTRAATPARTSAQNVAPRAGAATNAPHAPRKQHPGAPSRRGAPARRSRQEIGIHFERTRDLALETREGRQTAEKKKVTIPPLAPGDVRVVILGGVEEIGRNMAAVEYGNDIVIIDCGFMFKDDNTPGIDYILPDTTYLEDRMDKIRAMVITHGHLDHIGGIPYLIEKLGNPPIYARNLTAMIIKKRQDEFPHVPAIDLKIVETSDRVAFGDLAIRFFKVTHTIPDSMGVMVETPYGVIAHTGDLKLNHVGGVPTEEEEEEFGKFAKEKVLLLMADSTNCEKPGFSIPEPQVHRTIEGIIRDSRGRLIIATFASLLERIIAIIAYAEVMGKKVVIDGRSMKTNLELAEKAGMIQFKKGTLIPIEEMEQFPPDRIIMLVTGAQGDEFASLNRAAMKKHKYLKIREGDTVLFSSSVVPGNERAVQRLKDLLSRQGGRIVHYASSDVHSSGHANRDETMWIHSKVRPKFFIPLHGYHYFLRTHAEISVAAGTPRENVIIPDDGAIIEIRDKGEKMIRLPQSAPKEMIAVDGFSVGGMQEVVIRDRQMLAQEGIVVIVATVDMRSGKLMKSPDIVARGFVYVREAQDLLSQARLIVKKTVEDACGKGMKGVNFEYVKEDVRDRVGKFLFQKTNKQPMVIPVLLGM